MRAALALALLAGCAAPPPAEIEERFRTLETGSAVEAMKASDQLARSWEERFAPLLERALDAAPLRALPLAGDLGDPASAGLLLRKLPALLDGSPDVARAAATAAGLRRMREATGPLLERFEKLDRRALFRALGRIWDRKLDEPPLGRTDEILRLSVLAVAHRAAMGGDSTAAACETMFRVMTREELADFLGKHAGDRFYARGFCDQAVRRKGFDPDKGARIHEALLATPDLELLGAILATSPHALREKIVRSFLEDRRPVSADTVVADAAASRLTGKPLPSTRAERDALIRSLKKD